MSAPDFKQLLSKPVEDAKAPPTLPAGTYFGTITAFKFQESAWTNNDTGEKDVQCRYTIRNIEPGPDILPELLAEIDLGKRQLNADLPVSGGNEFVTRRFFEGLGIPVTGGRPWSEVCPEAVSHSVMFDLTHRLNKTDPTAPPFTDVRNLRARPA